MAKWSGSRIKKLRRRFGDTQQQFADRIRAGVQTLQDWEQGRREAPGPVQILFDCLVRELDAGQPPPSKKKSRQAVPA